MNKESFSGVLYKGFLWGNYWGNPDKYLKKIDLSKISFTEKKVNINEPIVTKLVINGKRV